MTPEQKAALRNDLTAVLARYGCVQPFVSFHAKWGGQKYIVQAMGEVPVAAPVDLEGDFAAFTAAAAEARSDGNHDAAD